MGSDLQFSRWFQVSFLNQPVWRLKRVFGRKQIKPDGLQVKRKERPSLFLFGMNINNCKGK
jgi:hypothetical protein